MSQSQIPPNYFDLTPLPQPANALKISADIMEPTASTDADREAIAWLRHLASISNLQTTDPMIAIMCGRLALNAELRASFRLFCDFVDEQALQG